MTKTIISLKTYYVLWKHLFMTLGCNFCLDKCPKPNFQKEELKTSLSVVLDVDTVIKELEEKQTYKYPGIKEDSGIQHVCMKEKIRMEHHSRVWAVLRSELNGRNKVLGINNLAVRIIYSSNILFWNMSEIMNCTTQRQAQIVFNYTELREVYTWSNLRYTKPPAIGLATWKT